MQIHLFHYLQKNGIGTTVHYKPLHKFTIFQNNSFQRKKLVISKKLYKEILSLPLYPQLTKSNQDYVAKYIKKALF